MKFFAELKRRNVYKVAVAYAVVGWLLVQVATQVFPFFEIPNWAIRLVVLAIVIGFPIALVIAWAFEADSGRNQANGRCRSCRRTAAQKIARLDLCRYRRRSALDRSVFPRSLHGSEQRQRLDERGGYSFVDSAKIDRGVAVRKSERRQGRRLFRRRHSGRNPDQAREHRRFESDLAHFDREVQEQAGRSKDSFATARRRDCS